LNIFPIPTSSNKFVSSNPNCPVDTLSVSGQSSLYDSAQETLLMTGDEVFEVDSNSLDGSTGDMSYTLELTDYANSVEAIYTYVITGTAAGGAQATATGTMTVQALCVATVTPDFDTDYYYNIPESGFDWIDLPFDGDSYVDLVAYTSHSGQTASCSREYSYRLSDPSANNDEITLSNF
jgi:hypothetical protein